jgi:Secretion system C-terminal sorting domain
MKNPFRPGLILLLLVSSMIVQAQVPLYSSYPSASAVIFLDFDGHTVDGTTWNSTGPIQCGPSGLDNTKITEVFNRVAEDYRPFNINITTDSTKFLSAPVNRRQRVIITVSSSWYGSAGGVAFVTSFTWSDDTPCFIFSALLNYNVKNIAEAAAHEAGHTLGLYHQSVYDAQCTKLSDYNTGVGSGEIGWAPIMGVGYYRNFTLWNNGPNSFGCTVMQSDLDIITTGNGFSYRTDDHSAVFGSATLANFVSNQFTINGIIERNTDQDLIRFIMPANGRFQLDAIPYNVGTGNSGSDLDMQVTLFNSSQVALNIYNPGALLNSIVDTVLDSGIYYLRVEGKGNLYAPGYASLGSYSLLGQFNSGDVLPLHKLELTGALSGDKHKLNWDIIADEQITDLTVEIATDGRTFSRLTQTAGDARSFIYRPYVNTSAQYRLNVTFDNGRQYYSNVVTIRQNGSTARPQLIGNLVTGNTITVSNPAACSYMLYDMNGRTIVKGQLKNGINTIDASRLVKGMYMIRFADNEQQWTDKIIRQ